MASNTPGRNDIVRHMFRCTAAWTNSSNDTGIVVGDGGYIEDASPNLTQVHVMIQSRTPNVRLQFVPTSCLEIGARYLENQAKPVVLVGPIFQSLIIRPEPPGNTSYSNDSDPFRRGVAFFLSGVWDHRSNLPLLSEEVRALISTDSHIKQTAQRIRNNVHQVNPWFFSAISNSNFTLEAVESTLTTADYDDHDAGIYLIILSHFKKGERLEGSLPIGYVGQSGDIGGRLRSHKRTADSNESGQEVHQVWRQAGRRRYYKLAVHQRDEGGSDKTGKAMRDIMETTFMMIFGTMSSRVMVPRLLTSNNDTLGGDIARSYDAQEMAKLFTNLARNAFTRAGFSIPGVSGRRDFGLAPYGCNYTIPLGGEVGPAYERTTWVRQGFGDLWSFRRAPLTFKKDKRVCNMSYSSHEGNSLTLIIQPSEEELRQMGIQYGEEFFPTWEVMKPGKGVHAIPFFRLCDIGPWSNWHYANKVAFKLVWYSKKDKKWKARYLQRQARHRFVDKCVAPGALLDYSLGIGIFSYFTRSRFPQAQSWSADFNLARIIVVSVNGFEQTITLSHLLSPAEDLSGKGPDLNANVARVKMENLGLQNVNGPWKGFDWGWLDDPTMWKDGVISQDAKQKRGYKGRTRCDTCFLAATSYHSGMHTATYKCVRVGNSNICEPCAKLGRPCSWTGIAYLYGAQIWLEETGRSKAKYGELHLKAVKALLCQPTNENALKVIEYDDKTGIVVMGEDRSQASALPVHWSQLSQGDRSMFTDWERRVGNLIGQMGELQVASPLYQTLMQQLRTLVDQVSTANISPMLRSYMNRKVEQEILYFMVNGRVRLRGG
ncbi:hypothetical protein Q7P37_003307 [Cladosporium fusiforme]